MSYLSLIPPLVVLILGFVTRRVPSSLIGGIIVACLIATDFSIGNSLYLTGETLWNNFEFEKLFSLKLFWTSWNIFICIFLFIIGIFVTLMTHSGGAFAYSSFVQGRLKDKRSAESASLTLSHLLFFDDYFSSLTVGSVMKPITDTYKVPRAKLAFLVDSFSAALAIMCPFSSWVAMVIGLLQENGIAAVASSKTVILAAPFKVYLLTLPFLFYTFLLVCGTWFIVRKKLSFGKMRAQEQIADETGNLFGGKSDFVAKRRETHERNVDNASLFDFFIPILILIFSVIAGLLFSGEASIFGGFRSPFEALQHANAAIALFVGGGCGLLLCTLYLILRRTVWVKEIPEIFYEGIRLMLPSVIILILAWSLGDILRNYLKTGEYLANLLLGSIHIAFLPALFFVVSFIISVAIGSSWGTAAIIFPIAIPMVLSYLNIDTVVASSQVPILFPIFGAVLSGCITGDHISPISDTTIMASTSAGSLHMDHVQTQLSYATPIICTTALTYLVCGILIPLGLLSALFGSLLFGVASTLLLLFYLNKKSQNLRSKAHA